MVVIHHWHIKDRIGFNFRNDFDFFVNDVSV
jgi:hypothetical protein